MQELTAGLTDQYCVTMGESFFLARNDQLGNDRVTFSLFARSLPKNRGYLVAMGVETVVSTLETLKFSEMELERLVDEGYTPAYIEFLRNWRFDGDVRAIPDGTIIAPQTPILEVDCLRISATLVESLLLSIIGHQTMIASKASRIVDSCGSKPVWDLSLRRLHGPQASYGVARAAYASGFAGTATINAAARLGIPSTGTMAHHFVMSYGQEREQDAFEHFLTSQPNRACLLVDTYDVLNGVRTAIRASQATGVPLTAIRLDSGDLLTLSIKAREILDESGFTTTKILASNDLDEYKILELLVSGAPIDLWGVGTMLSAQSDSIAALSVVFKICLSHEREPRNVIKLAEGKTTDPGQHQVWRTPAGDVLGLMDEGLDGEPLMRPFMMNGLRVTQEESLDTIRERVAQQRDRLSLAVRRAVNPESLVLQRSDNLVALRRSLGAKD